MEHCLDKLMPRSHIVNGKSCLLERLILLIIHVALPSYASILSFAGTQGILISEICFLQSGRLITQEEIHAMQAMEKADELQVFPLCSMFSTPLVDAC